MTDEDLAAMLFENRQDQTLSSRGWACPENRWIAAYVDGVLGERRKERIESHLADCPHCRLIVADVVRAQREHDLPQVPVELMRKAAGEVRQGIASWRWVWVPAGAAACLALLATLMVVFREPEQIMVVAPPPPHAPLTAKAEAVAVPTEPVRDTIRKPRTTNPVPTILSPVPDGVVRGDQLRIRWKPLSQSRYYGVRVVTSDGDLVWESQTEKFTSLLPSDVALKEGSYFVWVTAYLADGRVAKSPPVRFMVKR